MAASRSKADTQIVRNFIASSLLLLRSMQYHDNTFDSTNNEHGCCMAADSLRPTTTPRACVSLRLLVCMQYFLLVVIMTPSWKSARARARAGGLLRCWRCCGCFCAASRLLLQLPGCRDDHRVDNVHVGIPPCTVV